MHNDDLYDDIIGLAELELGVGANNSAEANGNIIFVIIFSRTILSYNIRIRIIIKRRKYIVLYYISINI